MGQGGKINKVKNAQLKESLAQVGFFIAATICIIAVIVICLFLFINGVPAIKEVGFFRLIAGTDWSPMDTPASYGIFPMIVGSVMVTAGAIIVGVPIGLFTSVFMAFFCPRRVYPALKAAVNLLAGIPSVIYGFFGITVIVPAIRSLFGGTGTSVLAASVLLGLMILPTIIGICESSLRAVPESYFEGAIALGAGRYYAIFSVTLPAAKSGVLSAIILGIGRAIGETMAVIMVAGNQARIPDSALKGVRTLTANIVLEMGYAADLHREVLIATGVVLFVFILIINLLFSVIKEGQVHD